MDAIPPVVIEAARNERKRLIEVRKEARAKIAELDAYLREIGAGSLRGRKENPKSLSGQIKAMARKMIVPGAYVPSRKIFEALLAASVVSPEGGKATVERVAKVVRGMELFVGDREKGWSLKSDRDEADPATGGKAQNPLR